MKTVVAKLTVPRFLLTKILGRFWRGASLLPTSPVCLLEIPPVSLPHPKFVRVRPKISGVSRTDLRFAFADLRPDIAPAAVPGGGGPVYLGHEMVGVVTEVGSAVRMLRVGDRVTFQRGDCCAIWANEPPCAFCAAGQYLLCTGSAKAVPASVGGGWSEELVAHEDRFFVVPPDISGTQAFLIGTAAVGVRAVLQHAPKRGARVLVLGAGTIGLLVLQVLRAVQSDCQIVVMAKYPHQRENALQHGAHKVIPWRDSYKAVAQITGGQHFRGPFGAQYVQGGFDLVYDTVGIQRTVTDSLRWVCARGKVVLVGSELRPLRLDITPIWWQEVELVGIHGHGMEEWQGDRIPTFDLTVRWIREKKLNLDNLISHRFTLQDYQTAIATAANKNKNVTKVVFEPNGPQPAPSLLKPKNPIATL